MASLESNCSEVGFPMKSFSELKDSKITFVQLYMTNFNHEFYKFYSFYGIPAGSNPVILAKFPFRTAPAFPATWAPKLNPTM